MYDSATPNPTGSLSGPYFLEESAQIVAGTSTVREDTHKKKIIG